jgi:hypothetical protein
MENVWGLASLWVGLVLVATLLGIWLKISTALSEIVVGTVAQLVIGAFLIKGGLGAKADWISFLAGTGAIVLTFLAGAELDPVIFRMKWKGASVVGLVGFFGPFLGCTAIAPCRSCTRAEQPRCQTTQPARPFRRDRRERFHCGQEFARQVLEERLHRPVSAIFEISALEHLDGTE